MAEGGCLYVLERLSDARDRGAKIYGELVGYAMNSDASDFVLPNPERQAQCIGAALKRAGMAADEVDIVSTHATGTTSGDVQECVALRQVFGGSNRTRSTTPRASSATRWERPAPGTGRQPAGLRRRRLPCHDQRRPSRSRMSPGRTGRRPACEMKRVESILNNSFGMLGINSVVIVKRV